MDVVLSSDLINHHIFIFLWIVIILLVDRYFFADWISFNRVKKYKDLNFYKELAFGDQDIPDSIKFLGRKKYIEQYFYYCIGKKIDSYDVINFLADLSEKFNLSTQEISLIAPFVTYINDGVITLLRYPVFIAVIIIGMLLSLHHAHIYGVYDQLVFIIAILISGISVMILLIRYLRSVDLKKKIYKLQNREMSWIDAFGWL